MKKSDIPEGYSVLFLGGGHNYDSMDIPMGKQANKPSTPLHRQRCYHRCKKYRFLYKKKSGSSIYLIFVDV